MAGNISTLSETITGILPFDSVGIAGVRDATAERIGFDGQRTS